MSEKTVELRKCQRIFFTVEDNIEGALTGAVIGARTIPLKFLNLSEGGVCFQIERSLCKWIAPDHVLALKKSGPGILAFLDGVAVQVKYALDFDIVPEVTFGCEFKELPKPALEEVKKIIAARLNT